MDPAGKTLCSPPCGCILSKALYTLALARARDESSERIGLSSNDRCVGEKEKDLYGLWRLTDASTVITCVGKFEENYLRLLYLLEVCVVLSCHGVRRMTFTVQCDVQYIGRKSDRRPRVAPLI